MKKLHRIMGEKGISVINNYGLHRESRQNNLNQDIGISIYSNKDESLRFSDHWGYYKRSDEIEKHDKPENMLLARKDKDGKYQLVQIVKKQNLNGRSINNKVKDTPKTLNPEKMAKLIVSTYQKWNNKGNLEKLPEMAREDFENIFGRALEDDTSGFQNFIEKYGKMFPVLSGITAA